MMSNEELRLAESAAYNAEKKEVVVTLRDGSRHAWPIHLLEMVKIGPSGWIPLTNITEQQLSKVIVYGGGKYILWDDIDQVFRISDLLAGVYGREKWTQQVKAKVASQFK